MYDNTYTIPKRPDDWDSMTPERQDELVSTQARAAYFQSLHEAERRENILIDALMSGAFIWDLMTVEKIGEPQSWQLA